MVDFAVGHVTFAFKVDRLIVQHRFAAIQVLDKLGDAPYEKELFPAFRFTALIGENDLQALIQKRQLPKTVRQNIEIERGPS